MKKMKKLLSVLMVITMMFSMAACGSKNASTKEANTNSNPGKEAAKVTSEADTGKLIEVTIPTFMAGENVGAVFFLPQVERFNKKYEGKYKINIEEVPQASYADKIKQLAQQNKLPALVHSAGSGGIDTQWFKDVVVANDMEYDLKQFLNDNPDVAANLVPDSIDYCTINGKVVNMPAAVLKPIGLYYNSTMYTGSKDIKDMKMDEFISSLGENKLAFMTADNAWTSGLLLTALIANQEGGTNLLKNAVDDKLYDYKDPILVNAVGQLQKLMQTNASSNSVGAAYADAANAFMSKNASIICNGSWMASEFSDASKDKWSNGFNGADVKATVYPGNVAIANSRCYGEFWVSNSVSAEEKELACAFLAFRASQDEIEALILAEGGNAPAIKQYSDTFLTKQKESPILAELSGSMDQNTTYSVSLFDVMPASVADTEFGKLLPKLVDGTLTPEKFCDELTKKAQEAKK